jgi:hypothetical protein
MDYELLKREIEALDGLRIDLSHTQKFPDIGGKLDIILADMQRTAKRIHDLVNPDEGGMLVSDKVETPQKGDLCAFWDNDTEFVRIRVLTGIHGELNEDEHGSYWRNCKVIKKGEGNV